MNENLVTDFYNNIRTLNFKKAALIIESVAKNLAKRKVITSSSLERLSELIKQEIEDEVDLMEVCSNILKLNIPGLSESVSEALKKLGPKDKRIVKLRRLIEALINFYRYYSNKNNEKRLLSENP